MIFRNHPKGLGTLSGVAAGERNGHYGLQALLVLYVTASQSIGGLGWSGTEAFWLFSFYNLAINLLGIVGGFIADRWFSRKKCVFWGGVILCIGHGILAIPEQIVFFGKVIYLIPADNSLITGLFTIALGVGIQKPNISTLVGDLYKTRPKQKMSGYYMYYTFINIGALIATIFAGIVAEKFGWHAGFGLAAIAVLLSLAIFKYGQEHLPTEDKKTAKTQHFGPLTSQERDRTTLLFISFIGVMVFWMNFRLIASAINVFTRDCVDRVVFGVEIPTASFQGLNPMFVIILTILIGITAKYFPKKQTSGFYKLSVGMLCAGIGMIYMVIAASTVIYNGTEVVEKAMLIFLVASVFMQTAGELYISPVGLKYVSDLAPEKYKSLLMGVYQSMIGIGCLLTGLVSSYVENFGYLAVFAAVAGLCFFMGLVGLLVNKRVSKLAHGAEDDEIAEESNSAEKNETQEKTVASQSIQKKKRRKKKKKNRK